MAGIFAFISYETSLTNDDFDILFRAIEKRGEYGTGLVIIDNETNEIVELLRSDKCYSAIKTDIKKLVHKYYNKRKHTFIGSTTSISETKKLSNSTVHNLQKTIQPIVDKKNNIVLVHNGAISEIDEERFRDEKQTDLDSEVIALSYLDSDKNIKKSLESISGGWSFIMSDLDSSKLIIGSSFIPLAHGYMQGLGYIAHSNIEAIDKVFSNYRDTKYDKLWDNFYLQEMDAFNYYEINTQTTKMNYGHYTHKFIHPVWKDNVTNKSKFIVMASSGVDSTTTLAYLKRTMNVDVMALHFLYGSRSQEAELHAVKKICEMLDVELMVLDIQKTYETVKEASLLLDENIRVNTGENLKTTDAWVPNRNALFINNAVTLAESLILKNLYSDVFITGGYPNIAEEAFYPDNSQRFVDAVINTTKFSTLPGSRNKIRWYNPFQNLNKTEELILMKSIEEYLYGLTVSCDSPKILDGRVYQCRKGAYAACGTGRESQRACAKAGITDTRSYYEVEGDFNLPVDEEIEPELIELESILKKINPIPTEDKN